MSYHKPGKTNMFPNKVTISIGNTSEPTIDFEGTCWFSGEEKPTKNFIRDNNNMLPMQGNSHLQFETYGRPSLLCHFTPFFSVAKL